MWNGCARPTGEEDGREGSGEHDGLSEASRRLLAAIDGRVRFEPVRPALIERAMRLQAAYPTRVPSLSLFYDLEAFRLGGYRKVLSYDSDVLFQGPVD